MKILITGGRGFIGRSLRKELESETVEFFILTRGKKEDKGNTHYINWSWKNPKDLSDLISQMDIVINLAGEHIADKPWTKDQKELIYKSRIETTKLIVNYINNSSKKPKKLISASAIGFYGNTFDEEVAETGSYGKGFLATLCKDWESEAQKANTNVTIIRIGLVIGKDGGVLPKMLPAFKYFVGGPLGSGKQWMSWISIYDVVGLIKFIIESKNASGIFNLTSLSPITNKDFSNILGKIMHRPSFMPIPAFGLKILFGEMASEMLLSGQKVFPQKAKELGYEFKYVDLEDAIRGVLDKRGG